MPIGVICSEYSKDHMTLNNFISEINLVNYLRVIENFISRDIFIWRRSFDTNMLIIRSLDFKKNIHFSEEAASLILKDFIYRSFERNFG